MRRRLLFFPVLFLIITGILSCKKNHYRVNTGQATTEIEIKRLEKDLFTPDPAEIPGNTGALRTKYGDFLQLFSYVINTGEVDDSAFGGMLTGFCTDRQNNEVYAYTMSIFPDLKDIEEGLGDGFNHYMYYFPGNRIPSVYSCITGFNSSIIAGDSVLGIGLDRYLGADCLFYRQLGIYSYLSARMIPESIVPDTFYGWAASEWDYASVGYREDNVLTSMIHEGKLRYFEKCMLPETPDELIFGFTSNQMKFCLNNEEKMWTTLVEDDLIFKTDQFTIRKLIGEAPFTTLFTNQSPGRAAVWTGFRIVESYMMKNPKVSLAELMNDTDVQGILEKAKYNP